MARAVKLLNNDLDFTGSRANEIEGKEEIAQRVGVRLKKWLGEWFLNNEEGIDYLGLIFTRDYSPERVKTEIISQVLDVEGVTSIDDYNQVKNDRELVVSFNLFTTDGQVEFNTRLGAIA